MITHRFLFRIALVATQAFAWVFVFHSAFARTGDAAYALASAALLYVLSHITSIFLAPFAARLLAYGALRMLACGTLAFAGALALWGAVFSGYAGAFMNEALTAGAILFGAFRALYTVPYALARPSHTVSSMAAEVLLVFLPAATGFLIASAHLAPSELLFASAALALLSLVFLAGRPESYERYSWSYREAFGELFESRERRLVLHSLARGAESAALVFLWPIAIFIIVLSYETLGVVLALSLLAILAVRLVRARVSPVARLPLSHTAAAASAWILRIGAFEPVSLMLVSVYGVIARPEDLGSIALTESAENSTYLDERTVLKEIAHSLGALAAALVVALAARATSLQTALVISFIGVALIAAAAAYWEHAEGARARAVIL